MLLRGRKRQGHLPQRLRSLPVPGHLLEAATFRGRLQLQQQVVRQPHQHGRSTSQAALQGDSPAADSSDSTEPEPKSTKAKAKSDLDHISLEMFERWIEEHKTMVRTRATSTSSRRYGSTPPPLPQRHLPTTLHHRLSHLHLHNHLNPKPRRANRSWPQKTRQAEAHQSVYQQLDQVIPRHVRLFGGNQDARPVKKGCWAV